MHNSECNGSESNLELEEENSELSRDLARCWEVEQGSPLIEDVQGHLLANVELGKGPRGPPANY